MRRRGFVLRALPMIAALSLLLSAVAGAADGPIAAGPPGPPCATAAPTSAFLADVPGATSSSTGWLASSSDEQLLSPAPATSSGAGPQLDSTEPIFLRTGPVPALCNPYCGQYGLVCCAGGQNGCCNPPPNSPT